MREWNHTWLWRGFIPSFPTKGQPDQLLNYCLSMVFDEMMCWKLTISLVEERFFKQKKLLGSTSTGFGLNSGTLIFWSNKGGVSQNDVVPPCTQKAMTLSVDSRVFKTQWMHLVFKFGKKHTSHTPPKTNMEPQKMVLCKCVSFSMGVLSGSMLIFRGCIWKLQNFVSFQGLLDVDSLSVENIEILLESH